MKISDSKYGILLSLPGLILLLVWVLFPFGYNFYLSFLRYDNVNPVVPYGFENYRILFNDASFWSALRRTFIYSFGSTALTLFVGLTLALCLNRIVKGSAFFRSLMIMPWAVPMVLSGFIWAWMFNPSFGVISDVLMKLGVINEPLNIFANPSLALGGVIIADAWRRIPFLTVLTLAGLQAIPRDLYDAAKVDGADSLDTFRHVSLPLVKRPMLIGLLITLMFSFRTVSVVYSMTPGGGVGKSTYVLGLYVFDQLYEFLNFGLSAASGVALIIVTIGIGSVFVYYTLRKR